MSGDNWPRFISASERRAMAEERLEALRSQGTVIQPVRIQGQNGFQSVWGRAWYRHISSLRDIGKRLPHGQIYARNGSIRHLEVLSGKVQALVMGTKIYDLVLRVLPVRGSVWQDIKNVSSGRVDSVEDILQGQLPAEVMDQMLDPDKGLFPVPKELSWSCTCQEKGPVCKHVAAVLYGVGARFDQNPDDLFRWRGVRPQDLILSRLNIQKAQSEYKEHILSQEQAGDIFGLEWDNAVVVPEPPVQSPETGEPKVGRSESKQEQKIPLNPPTGESVLSLRERAGLSVQEFAQRIGVSLASVYRWEKTSGELYLRSRPLKALRQLSREVSSQGSD